MKLPALREELAIRPGPRLHDGQPSWTLHDPARHRFFRLDWLTFELLQRWSLGDSADVIAHVSAQTPLRPAEDDVLAVLKFVAANQLLQVGPGHAGTLAGLQERSRPGWWAWLVHNYLFFRVPLVRPDRMLRGLERVLPFLFRPAFWALTGGVGVVGLVLLAHEWTEFAAGWGRVATPHGLLGLAAVLVGVKVIHEFGHGIVAVHYGCRVPTMGIAFLVMTPVAYTDTNEAWNLTARKPRLLIGGAGMLAELCLAAWATLAWSLLPDGGLRSAALVVACVTWVKSLLLNASPFMRFDGYYLLSDFLDLPNLHARAFALARWRLREGLFRLGEPPPEYFRLGLRRGLVALAVFIWLYRLVVFTGIAIFVYHFFFKALGIVLFAVEMAWFVVLPIVAELRSWSERWDPIRRSPRSRRLLAAAVLALLLFAVPLPQRVSVLAQYQPGTAFRIVAPEAGEIVSFAAADGARLEAGQPVLRLESAALQQRRERAVARLAAAEEAARSAVSHQASRSRLPVLQAEIETARAAVAQAKVDLDRLEPVAPFAGILRFADGDPRPGESVGRDEPLATVVGDSPWRVVAYVNEHMAHLVVAGAGASFVPDGSAEVRLEATVEAIEPDASRSLAFPLLASVFGGSVPARAFADEVVPESAVYRVTLVAPAPPRELGLLVRRGRITIRGASEPLGARFARRALSVFWRELGF